ncbi:MAG: hypothetical protein ACOYN2_01935 [Patescibacteria group bacterium]
MKNIKTIGVTAAIATISLVGTIFTPNVLAYKAVSDGLGTVAQLESQNISEVYSINVNDFEKILTTAKKSSDLKVIPEEEANKLIEKSDMSIGRTTTTADTSTANAKFDSRIVKFISFTNETKEKVVVGLDKDNLPILMTTAQ